jgi:WD40 repeat protein
MCLAIDYHNHLPFQDKSEATKISDVYRFLLQQQPLIQDSALQTYTSALAFTPEGSPILDEYRSKYLDRMPRIISTTPSFWSARHTLTGHTGYVRHLEFSPDGNRLATGSEDSSLILWDTNSGAIVGHPFKGEDRDPVVSVTYSPDGKKLAFATESSKIYLWSSTDGKQQISTIDASPGRMVQIAFSPTQPYLISASAEPWVSNRTFSHDMRFWSTQNGQMVGQKIRLEGGARSFAVSPDGLRVVCVSKHSTMPEAEGLANLWSLETFMQLAEYQMPIVHEIPCTLYSPTGARFVTWNQSSTIYLRNGITGEQVTLIEGEEKSLRGVCFSPDGKIMASFYGYENPIIHLWDPVTGVKSFTLSGHSSTISYVAFSLDSLRLASVSIDQTLRVWDTSNGNSVDSFFSGYTGNVSSPVLSPDWSKLVTVSFSHQINLHDINAGTMQGLSEYEDIDLDMAHPIVAFSPNGDVMVCGFADLNERSTLGLWSLETCLPVGIPMVGHTGGAVSVAFSNNAKYVSSLSVDITMRLWDGSTGSPIGDSFSMWPLYDGFHTTFSPDSKLVGCSAYDGIKVWQIHTRTKIMELNRRGSGQRIVFSPDSSRIAGYYESGIGIWDLTAGPSAPPKLINSGGGGFHELVFSPTDDLIVSVQDSEVRIWKIAAQLQLMATLSTNPAQFRLGISSNGRFLAHGSSIWDLSSLPESPRPLDDRKQSSSPLNWKEFPHSLLTYEEGWINSALPPGRLLPIPRHLWWDFRHWDAYGHKVVIWTQQRLPIIIDTSPLFSSALTKS